MLQVLPMVSTIKSSLAFLLKARLQTGHREASGIQERRWPFAGSKGRVLILAHTSSLEHRGIMVTWAPGTPAVGVGNRIPLQGNKVADNLAEDSG